MTTTPEPAPENPRALTLADLARLLRPRTPPDSLSPPQHKLPLPRRIRRPAPPPLEGES
ncbi:hypothetical protein ACWFMI_12995 [Nocardiopsis terrae]